jgi:hypothetical protein
MAIIIGSKRMFLLRTGVGTYRDPDFRGTRLELGIWQARVDEVLALSLGMFDNVGDSEGSIRRLESSTLKGGAGPL